jgi:flagellar motor switch protein FliM
MSEGDLLNEDQIAKLFEQAANGKLKTDVEAKAPGRRTRGLRTVDFQHPTKFTADQERRIKRALETFCSTANRRLAAELRVDVELEVIDVMQLTWLNAHAQVPFDSLCAVLEEDGRQGDSHMLLTAEHSLVVEFVERLLGGTKAAGERRLTDIDLVLARRFFTTLTEELSLVWAELARGSLSFLRVDSQPESTNLAASSDPTLALVLEGRLDRASSTVVLLIPYQSAAGIVSAFAGNDADSRDPRIAQAVDAALRGVAVPVRAEVASTTMQLDDILALRPGDTVEFRSPVADGITLMADKVPVHIARPGRCGRNRAIQIVASCEEER